MLLWHVGSSKIRGRHVSPALAGGFFTTEEPGKLLESIPFKFCITYSHVNFPQFMYQFSSVQFCSVAQSCQNLCYTLNRSTSGLPVHHQLLEFTQTHVHRVHDAIQPSHPRLSPSPSAPIPPSIRVFSNESTLCMRWPKY